VIYTNVIGHKAFILEYIQRKTCRTLGKDDIKVDIWEPRCVYWIPLFQNTVKCLEFRENNFYLRKGGRKVILRQAFLWKQSTVNIVSCESSGLPQLLRVAEGY
jgi:hypothetical protein